MSFILHQKVLVSKALKGSFNLREKDILQRDAWEKVCIKRCGEQRKKTMWAANCGIDVETRKTV